MDLAEALFIDRGQWFVHANIVSEVATRMQSSPLLMHFANKYWRTYN